VADWWAALYLDGLPAGASPREYPTIDLRAFLGSSFPLVPGAVNGGAGASGSLWSSSAAYYIVSPGLGGSVTVRLGGEAAGPSPAQSVLRLRIVRLS
jgi:hypothetical protein